MTKNQNPRVKFSELQTPPGANKDNQLVAKHGHKTVRLIMQTTGIAVRIEGKQGTPEYYSFVDTETKHETGLQLAIQRAIKIVNDNLQ